MEIILKTFILILGLSFLTACQDNSPKIQISGSVQEGKNINLILNMVSDLSENMNIKNLDQYFSNDFIFEINKIRMNLSELKNFLADKFKSLKKIQIKRPIRQLTTQQNQVTSRVVVITTDKKGVIKQTEVTSSYQIKDNKIVHGTGNLSGLP